jgi:ribosomal protein S12 methylthiotransferase
MKTVAIVSLGCPKNLVDSETLIKKLMASGISCSSNPDSSDVILINTCGFIEDAKKESIQEILRIAEGKKQDRQKRLIVFGCLAERYGKELQEEIPEIDALWGVDRAADIVDYCKEILSDEGIHRKKDDCQIPSLISHDSFAYIKIAEGCDRTCSFCVIPSIRGKYQSRNPDEIVREAEERVRSGTKELILVAQDITSYGKEIGTYSLSRLLRNIASLSGNFWIRLLYLYPAAVSDELIETIGTEDKVCNYIDMPLQHSEERILRLMGRGGSRKKFEELVLRIRRALPDVVLRTTLIVGFPQETDKEFDDMAKFVQNVQFEHLGVFMYSPEEGTDAYTLKGQVSEKMKQKRYNEIMSIQSAISLKKNKRFIGRTFKALVDDVENNIAIARLYSQAPDIDGVVFVQNETVDKGAFVTVRIDEAYDYDLRGTLV